VPFLLPLVLVLLLWGKLELYALAS